MIVGSCFNGDDDTAFQWQQHDRYGEALDIIAYGCIEHYKNAAIIRGEYDFDMSERVGQMKRGFDHRTLQSAHDYLAAWWRWKHNRHDSFSERMEPVTVEDWLRWLRKEVETWSQYAPDIVRLIVKVLLNQNTDAGYEAEKNLQQTLKDHYREMPERSDSPKHTEEEGFEESFIANNINGGTQMYQLPKNEFSYKKSLPELSCIVLLLWALLPSNPYGYYMGLRMVVCGISIYLVIKARGAKMQIWMYAFVGLGLLYNPLFRVHLDKDIWGVINMATIIMIIWFSYSARKKTGS